MIYPQNHVFFKKPLINSYILKIDEKTTERKNKKKDLKDLSIFAYLSINYKATETNKHFYISFVNIASGKIYKNID